MKSVDSHIMLKRCWCIFDVNNSNAQDRFQTWKKQYDILPCTCPNILSSYIKQQLETGVIIHCKRLHIRPNRQCQSKFKAVADVMIIYIMTNEIK